MAKLVSSRYSEAFFDLALQSSKVEVFAKDAALILAMLDKDSADADSRFGEFLYHPQISEGDKIRVVETALGGKVNAETIGLIVVMIQKQRERELSAVLEMFLEKVQEYEGIAEAFITYAAPIDEGRLETIRGILSEKFNKKVVLRTGIDKELVGGFKVLIQGYSFDRTIKTALGELRASICTDKACE
ncbi:MAG: ATP synthase F1 subunit delta [Defluviitaleaceae bacterium]|nr:ATP synthase F1 subunit delta [Defluviitaleaceae bacterium]